MATKTVRIQFDENGSPINNQKLIRLEKLSSEIIQLNFILKGYNSHLSSKCYVEIKKLGEEKDFERNKISFFQATPYDDAFCFYLLKENGVFYQYRLYNGQITGTPNYIHIHPIFTVKIHREISINELCIVTMVPKWMGNLQKWSKHLEEAAESGYNMIHYVPMQERGHSNSPYSIKNQLKLSAELIPPDCEKQKDCSKDPLEQLRLLIKRARDEYGLLSITDVVWNHTSCDSDWLRDHPECGYNLQNSPHLNVAYELDCAILKFSTILSTEYSLPSVVMCEVDVDLLLNVFLREHLPKYRLWEYFLINSNEALEFEEKILAKHPFIPQNDLHFHKDDREKTTIEFTSIDHNFLKNRLMSVREDRGRFSRFICYKKLSLIPFSFDVESKDHFSKIIEELNCIFMQEYTTKITRAIENIKRRLLYERLDPNGPKFGPISKTHPIASTYFTRIFSAAAASLQSTTTEPPSSKEIIALANNGWIWGGSPLVNFASPDSDVYFTRDLIVWGDCVKLRYGDKYDDNPWLWDHMREYSTRQALLFDGFRIDNCHSTPIHVAKYLVNEARKVNQNLYIVAELFSGSEELDYYFVGEIGIDSLIREAMNVWDGGEICRTSYRYGGQPIGSFLSNPGNSMHYDHTVAFHSLPHALYMDCTHDNQMPSEIRTPEDSVPNMAIVSFNVCAIGSIWGYDAMLAKQLDIVNESREYDEIIGNSATLKPLRLFLNNLHKKMYRENYVEFYAESDQDVIKITRERPEDHSGYVLIAWPAYNQPVLEEKRNISILYRHCEVELVLDARIKRTSQNQNQNPSHPLFQCHMMDASTTTKVSISFDSMSSTTMVQINHLKPGDVVVLKKKLLASMLKNHIETLSCINVGSPLITEAVQCLGLTELNCVLYKSSTEEYDVIGHNAYTIPNYGDTSYCGFEGFANPIKEYYSKNDLSHPLCENLREGDWILNFFIERLHLYSQLYSTNEQHNGGNSFLVFPNLTKLYKAVSYLFTCIKAIPYYLKPLYFSRIVLMIYEAAIEHSYKLLGVEKESLFIKHLALTSVQLIGWIPSAALSPGVDYPFLSTNSNLQSLAAGLPYFATRHMRCWGRDVFVSFKGIFLLTGRFEEGKQHILSFAGCIYNGLIPNLLDSCRFPRYNARDAVWWFLQSIQDYCSHVKNYNIIFEDVPLRFNHTQNNPTITEYSMHTDDGVYAHKKPLIDLIVEILQMHFNGIDFVEWNAGTSLDHSMKTEGFHISISVDRSTGFVVGGNNYNCGTWMDKMGDCVDAGTAGIPATPRDGAAIEIVALQHSCLKWLFRLYNEKIIRINGVASGEEEWTFKEWYRKIEDNFEHSFFIPKDPNSHSAYCIDSAFVNRTGIYKDTYQSSIPSNDYQLRPNYLVAMTLAPSMFRDDHAREAIEIAENVLLGPLGIKTLDPQDPTYNGWYNNDDSSSNPLTAHGYNYHRGPEWVWLMGKFLIAKSIFFSPTFNTSSMLQYVRQHMEELIERNPFRGLPELTNHSGQYCQYSCQTQAWSSGCLLEAMKFRCT